MKIEGVIFDLDGTLIHTIEDIAGAANEMFCRNGLPTHEVSHYLKWIGSGAVKFIERALATEIGKDQLMEYVAEFREIYEPIAKDIFKDSFMLNEGKFEKDSSST